MALPEQAPSEQALPMQAPSEQALPEPDRIGISDLINLHGHLMDAGELNQALDTADERAEAEEDEDEGTSRRRD